VFEAGTAREAADRHRTLLQACPVSAWVGPRRSEVGRRDRLGWAGPSPRTGGAPSAPGGSLLAGGRRRSPRAALAA
jgi:hypothetical protein